MGTLNKLISKQRYTGQDLGRIFLLMNLPAFSRSEEPYEDAEVRVDETKWNFLTSMLYQPGNEKHLDVFKRYQALSVWIADIQLQIQSAMYAASGAYKTLLGEMISYCAVAKGMTQTFKSLPAMVSKDRAEHMDSAPEYLKELAHNGVLVINEEIMQADKDGVFILPVNSLADLSNYWVQKYERIPMLKDMMEEQWQNFQTSYMMLVKYNEIGDLLASKLGIPELKLLKNPMDDMLQFLNDLDRNYKEYSETIDNIPYMQKAEKEHLKKLFHDNYPSFEDTSMLTIPQENIKKAGSLITRSLANFPDVTSFYKLWSTLEEKEDTP